MNVELFSWLSKALLYGSTTIVIGALFIRVVSEHQPAILAWLQRYTCWGALLGFISVLMSAASQLILFSGQGVASLTDWDTFTMLLNSNLGWAWCLSFLGFLLCGLSQQTTLTTKRSTSLLVVGLTLVILSFWFTGHLVDTPWFEHVALLFHLVAMSMWLGSLVPLWRIITLAEPALTRRIMLRFGEVALYFIPVLVIAGVFMLQVLLGDLRTVLQSSYGQAMVLKLTAVAVLLGLGAFNKLVLVPRLPEENVACRLRRSIAIEMLFGAVVLGLTALATVIIGVESGRG